MTTLTDLSDLERRILANLEECGEDYVTALLNSVIRCHGEDSEVVRFVTALHRLFDFRLIEFANRRAESSLEWEVLAHDQSVDEINLLSTRLKWESDSCLWTWNADAPRLTVLLTENGGQLSREILETFGWEMTEPM